MSAAVDEVLRHHVYVQRLASQEVAKFIPFLKQMDSLIRDRLSEAEELTDLSRQRLEQLLRDVDALLGAIYTKFGASLGASLAKFAQYEMGFSALSLEQLAGTGFESVLPALTQIRAAITSVPLGVKGPLRGKLLRDVISDWSVTERAAVSGILRRGAYEGKTNADLIREIRGTPSARFQNGRLDLTRRHAEAIVRTAVNHVSTVARTETVNSNKDIIAKVQWVATLDRRTCPQCAALDGRQYPLDKGPRAPLHIGCRCTMIPVLKDELQYLSEGRTRASKGAEGGQQVDAKLTYYEWLKTQPASFQDDVLGPTRGQLFRDGGLSATRFAELQLDKRFEPLTLDEMRERDPAAFKKAGL